MKEKTYRWSEIELIIKHFVESNEGRKVVGEDTIKLKGDSLRSLMEIHPDPTKAIVLALQIALRLRKFDPSAAGSFEVLTKQKRGTFQIPEWKSEEGSAYEK